MVVALLVRQALRFGETAAAVDLAAKDIGAERAAAAALASLDAQISSLEQKIIEKVSSPLISRLRSPSRLTNLNLNLNVTRHLSYECS